MNLDPGSYEAYCLDEAVFFFGVTFENMLEDAGHKPSKEERKAKAAREKIVQRMFDPDDLKKKSSGFADPALMF